MTRLHSQDTISGKEGRAFVKINGNNEELFFAKTIEATVEKAKSEIKSIGKRMTGHKTTGLSGTGSMTIYYMTPLFRSMLQDFKNKGRDVYFDMVVENEDGASAAGKQVVHLMGVNLNSTILTKLDGDSDDPLDEEIEFTFEDFNISTPFKKIIG
ncbi:phage tail tube protein [Paenibacillus sp. GCM10027627]|uniref:phage tail tube protein n=1 Tax=unclassified Paenibacillus TaxID=185978 RepID=UPI0036268CFA